MKNFSLKIFEYRSYTPIPFLILMLIFQKVTLTSLLVGFPIALIGEWLRLWGVSYAGSETRTTGGVGGTFLVISGPFAHVRNPLYLGNILIYLGIGVMSMALFPYLQIAAFLFFYFQYYFIIKEEEKYLIGKFNGAYEDYRRSVPKLIPSPVKYKNPSIEQPVYNLKLGLRSERRTLQAFISITVILIIIFAVSNIG